ncbi:MAG: winged helix-turn-helix domain-containing protein [Bryobacteraceae bacterium]
MLTQSRQPRLRFAGYEMDTRSGELLCNGTKVNLQDQPARALLILLERPGELVTRSELIEGLWPKDTLVDFERGLNKIVAKLRAALDDDLESPRFIETVPKRGYRFMAPVNGHLPLDGPALNSEPPAQTSEVTNTIAVLPFANDSGDPSQEYFCDGVTGEIISALSAIGSVRVISRTSAMAYKGVRKPLPEVAADLRVSRIIEGSVARHGSKVRIIVHLIQALDDRHIWTGRYERNIQDILQLQAEVAANIAREVHRILDPAAPMVAPLQTYSRKICPEAYESYLKGTFFHNKLNPADLAKATRFFHQAIEIDPSYAPAIGSLARCYHFAAIFGLRHPVEAFHQVRVNAIRALELAPSLTSAQVALAAVNVFDRWDWIAATNECRRAVEADPGDSFARGHLADYLSIRGGHEEAIAEMKAALDLDPISTELNNWLALIYYRARRYSDSIDQCRRVLEIDPHYVNVLWFRSWAFEQLGKMAEAVADLEKAVESTGGVHYRAQLGRLYGKLGQTEQSEAILNALRDAASDSYVSPLDLAMVHLGLGDIDAMFRCLDESASQRVWRTNELTMPIFDCVRNDRSYHSLLRRVGLAD